MEIKKKVVESIFLLVHSTIEIQFILPHLGAFFSIRFHWYHAANNYPFARNSFAFGANVCQLNDIPIRFKIMVLLCLQLFMQNLLAYGTF